MTDALRSLLAEVAEGRLDPSEAARRLSEIDDPATSDASVAATGTAADGGDAPSPSAEGATAAPAAASTAGPTAQADQVDQADQAGTGADEVAAASPSDGPVERVLVQASARPVRVVADPTVATLTVDGPHTVRRDGGTIRVDVPVMPGSQDPGSYRYERKTGLSRWISQATLMGVPLSVRINPDLALEAEIMAGSLDVVGLRAPLTFSVTAGSLRATDCTGPFTGTVRAGGARLDVQPVAGASRVRVESGGIDVRIRRGSDVRVRARAELGEVKVKGPDGSTTRVVDREGVHEAVVGAGAATFDLEVVMGSIKVQLP